MDAPSQTGMGQTSMTQTSMVSSPTVRVGVIDDHEMFRAGVIATLHSDQAIEVVAQGYDVDSAVQAIAQTQPDVVLLDVHIPGGHGGGGAEIIEQARPYAPQTKYLALSVSDSAQDVGAVIRAGALGYVTKTISGSDLLAAIRQVYAGYSVFSPKLAGFVLSLFQQPQDNDMDQLSEREQQVLRLIARGYTYKEVAAELFISIKTVESHVSAVLRKLQLSNRNELTRWATYRHIV